MNIDIGNYKDAKLINKSAIDESIKNIIMTKKGTLPGLPEFGSDIYHYLFEQLNPVVIYNLKTSVLEAIERWEPRVKNIKIDVNQDADYGRIMIFISYDIIENNESNTVKITVQT